MPENIGPITETKAFEQLGILVLDGSGSTVRNSIRPIRFLSSMGVQRDCILHGE
jgi:hypothetical protein